MSTKIEMGEEYAQRYESLLMATKRTRLARVWPFPGTVVLEMSLLDDELTPAQAVELAGFLVKAAEDARHLSGVGDEGGLVDDRSAGDLHV